MQGDVTKLKADAIVNTANPSLPGSGAVEAAIQRSGGPEILEAYQQIVARQGGAKTGEAVITAAGNLPARFVIHTVAPVWQGGKAGEEELLACCYMNCLQLAQKNYCDSVSFPNIGTGGYHFPKRLAARISVHTVCAFLETHDTPKKVNIVCNGDENFRLCSEMLHVYECL